MAKKIRTHQEDSETIYRLLRQAIRMAESVAQPDYPLTAHMLRIAMLSLEDELKEAIKAEAEIAMRYV